MQNIINLNMCRTPGD